MNKNIQKKPITQQQRYLLMGIGIALLLAAGFGLWQMPTEQTVTREEPLYSCQVSADTSYEVALLPNHLFAEQRLPENRIYSRQLTDYIEFAMSAVYEGSEAAEIQGSGQVVAVLRAVQIGSADQMEKLIYEHRYPLGEGQLERTSDSDARVSALIQIRPQDYQQAATAASEMLGASPNFQCYLLFEGSFQAVTAHGDVEVPFSCQASVPIGREVNLYEVTKQPGTAEDSITTTEESVERVAPLAMVALVVVVLLGLGVLAFAYFFTRLPDEEEQYQMELRSMIRKYGDRMVRLNQLPNMETMQIVAVTDINSLLLLAEELRQPILYTADAEGCPEHGRFCIAHGQTVFLLELQPPSTTFVVEQDGWLEP